MKTHPHILVAHKKSRYEHYVLEDQDQSVEGLVEACHISVESLLISHETHIESVERITGTLNSHGLSYDTIYRGDVTTVEGYDLIISIGGDGTVLDLSHGIEETPILGINSDPDVSVGYFTAGTARDFPRLLDMTLKKTWQPQELRRFFVRINDEIVGPPVLNDALIAHLNPAAVSHYLLQVGNHPPEEQKSSGIWVATPAGSTAAIRSAGGHVMPIGSETYQYLVREPYPPKVGGYRFLKGIQPFDDVFEVVSKMREGRVFLDGPHLMFPFGIGDTVSIDPAAPLLRIYGVEEERRTA
ncbi:MAG: NAD(+)/NADH kinase [Bradymonadaceae bacterium]